MKRQIAVFGGFVATLALAAPANANVLPFTFSGAGASASGLLTFVPNVSPPDPNPACGTPGNNPCRADPPGAFAITGISGTFSDPADGIVNAAISDIVLISPANERDATFDPLVPTSLSFVDYAPGESFTYNNLLFPYGSPIDCDYLYSGTFLDVFGMAFTLEGGQIVNIWGDGDVPVLGLTYGIRLISDGSELINQFAGASFSVPEPASLALLGIGALGLLGLRRNRREHA